MSMHTPTRATPFSLTYGAEVVLPLEVEIPSLRVSLKALVTYEDYYAMRLQELEPLDEKCQASFDHMRVYQKHSTKRFILENSRWEILSYVRILRINRIEIKRVNLNLIGLDLTLL